MKLLLKTFLLILLFSCQKEIDTEPNFVDPNPNDVDIKIENKSNYTLDSLFINTSGGDNIYNSVKKNRETEYKSFRFSYSYFYLRFKVGNKVFLNQPIDYVGEKKIAAGKYTLTLSEIDTLNLSFKSKLELEN